MPNLKLTDSQSVILSAASARTGGQILPLPKSLAANKASASRVLQGLLSRNLVAERTAKLGEEAWKEKDGERLTLEITSDGLAAIGVEAMPADRRESRPKSPKAAKERKAPPTAVKVKGKSAANKGDEPTAQGPKPTSKLGMVIAALRSRKGATIDDLIEATSWQAHSIRGAISGALKKKLGLKVESSTVDGRGRVYRISE